MSRIDLTSYLRRNSRTVLLIVLCAIFVIYNVLGSFLPSTLDSMRLYENMERETVEEAQTCKLPLLHPFEEEVVNYFKPPTPISCRARTGMLSMVDNDGYLKYNETAWTEAGLSISSQTCVYQDDEEVGIAVVGLDSVSRLNFMRQLPRSFDVLTNTMGAVVFKGFNKVGHNTLPNIVPILTGSPPSETTDSTKFDDWPFIWNELNKDNVATFYGEDLSRISTFAWWGSGFEKQPTTHYFRPYWVAVDPSSLNSFSSNMCLGPVPKHSLYLQYLKSFLRAYQSSPLFMFSLENEPSHDYLNTVGVMDRDLEEFLLSSYNEGLFNRTILFVLADHGNRMDVFRSTKQGRIEDSLPMVSMVLPPWMSEKYPNLLPSLRNNSKRLSSSYDLYATFVDILQGTAFGRKAHGYHFADASFGQSLFQPIPLERTCEDAGIPDMFCVCETKNVPLEVTDQRVVSSALILIDYMNQEILNMSSSTWTKAVKQYQRVMHAKGKTDLPLSSEILEPLQQCAFLTLDKIEEAELTSKAHTHGVVHLTFSAQPSGALFEGRVLWTLEGQGRIHEEILRVNRYGNQPDCLPKVLMIMVPLVRMICYCQ